MTLTTELQLLRLMKEGEKTGRSYENFVRVLNLREEEGES